MINRNIHFVFISINNPTEALGLRAICSVLKNSGYRASQLMLGGYSSPVTSLNAIYPTNNEKDLLIEKLKELQPDMVGISVSSAFGKVATEITRRIQGELEIPVIWGGIHPTLLPEECIKIADLICIGEGEDAVLELAQRMSEGRNICAIRNIWLRKGKDIIKNDLRPLKEDLDQIPFPDYTSEDKYCIYGKEITQGLSPSLCYLLMTTRGCPFDCSFCVNSALRKLYQKNGLYLRRRSVDNVIDEILKAKEHLKIRSVNFYDDILLFNEKWIYSFCREYKKAINLPFSCYIHPSLMSQRQLDLLITAGLRGVRMGIESGSQRVRFEVFQRPVSDKAIINASWLFSKYKFLYVFYDLIVDNPFETKQDKRDALRLMLSLSQPFSLCLYRLYFCPGNRLTQQAMDEGIIPKKEQSTFKTAETDYRSFLLPESDGDIYWFRLLSYFSIPKVTFSFSNWFAGLLANNKYIQNHSQILELLYNVRIKIFHSYYMLINNKIVKLYKRAFLYYKKHGFKKFHQRLLEESRIVLRRNFSYQEHILVVRNIHKAPFSISPPLLPINFSLLNEYILDKSDISLLGNKEVVLKSLQKGDIYFISQYKDRVIAYIWLTLQDSFISWPSARLRLQDKEIYCVNITTHNEYRGKGIIPDAIYKGFEILRQFGYQRVYGLILCKNRPSLRTAQRCGFSQIRRIFFLKLLTIKINLSINPNLYFLIRRKS